MGKYQAYLECRNSEISWLGEIPLHWQLNRFKNIFKIKKRIAGKLGFDILSITQRGVKIKDTESGDGQLSMDYSKYQLVFKNDFAMNHMDLLTGFVDISLYEGVTSPDYRVFTLEDRESFDRYFLYLLQMCYTNKIFYPLGQGASTLGRWRLPTEAFNEFVSPIPPMKEQQIIANFLDHETAKIDTLIEKQQQLIQLLKEKRQAVISRAVTKGLNPDAPMKDSGVEWLGEVPEHWEVCAIKYLSNGVFTGGTPKSELSYSDLDSDINWFGPGDFGSTRQLNESHKYVTLESYKRGDSKIFLKDSVLVIGIGATLGKVGYCLRNFSCNQQINVIYPNERVFCKFLALSLSTQEAQMKLSSNASTIGIMNQEKTKSILITVPSLSEQEAILNHVDFLESKYSELIELASSQVELLQERRTALISAAVTGKIDVRHFTLENGQGK